MPNYDLQFAPKLGVYITNQPGLPFKNCCDTKSNGAKCSGCQCCDVCAMSQVSITQQVIDVFRSFSCSPTLGIVRFET